MLNNAIVPSSQQPIADNRGQITTPWQRFFNALVAAAGSIQSVAPTASPFSYRAGGPGSVAISGGTVSSITLTRNNTTIPLGSVEGTFPVASGDVITTTYTVAPTISFIPI